MMKRKIFALTAVMMLFASAVSASSINGDYKGNQIAKVIINGVALNSEVPAQIIDGSTLLPLRSISEALGANVSWDQDSYTVDIKSDEIIKKKPMQAGLNYVTNVGGGKVSLSSNGTGGGYYEAETNYGIQDNDYTKQMSKISGLLYNLALTGAKQVKVNIYFLNIYNNDTHNLVSISAYSQDILDFYEGGKISESEMLSRFTIFDSEGKLIQKSSRITNQQPAQNNSPTTPTPTPTRSSSTSGYSLNDALIELGVPSNATPTLQMKDLAIQLVEIRKIKKQSDYSVKDALRELGIPDGAIPTLGSLKQAIQLIRLHD